MSSDKRTVATDALATLGTIIEPGTQKRDAIHLASEPAVAGEALHTGDHVRIKDGIAYRTGIGEGVGIVDPFLRVAYINKGQGFWLLLYPGMINSLRHVWTHPAFPDEITAPTSVTKMESELWLRKFCDGSDCPAYDTVMELIDKGTLPSTEYTSGGEYNQDYLLFQGRDAHGTIPPEFWDHAENVLGRKLPWRPTYLSCSC